jgi:crotonobetainyl-CoA:carnitine CoA-transferase CaiB-like acyl-CoA transferase
MALPQPLIGRCVIELAQFIAGPTAAQLLADFGAEVIKVEAPNGDGSRALPGTSFGSVYSRSFNTSKSSIVIDTRRREDREKLDKLLSGAHALISNMAPRALRRLELDPASIRRRFPRLIATLVSGYGQDDKRTCMDTIAQSESGFAWLNGADDGTPRNSTSWPTDFFSGLYAGLATAMALADQNIGEGCIIDISMMEVAAAMLLGPAALTVAEGGQLAPPVGNRDRASAPSGIYPCRDGYVYIYAGSVAMIRSFRPNAVSRALASGEHVPSFPALFDGERLARSPTPAIGGVRRPKV